MFFLLKRLNLAFCQDHTSLSDFGFQSFQTQLEVLQIMAQPDRADARGRDKDTLFAKFIGRTHLTVSWELNRERGYSVLGGFIHTIGKVWFPARAF
jgi:hypothetical protein